MAFSYLLLFFLVFLCVYIFFWTFKSTSRIYQFPLFVATACLIYIVPQLWSLIADPFPVSQNYVDITIFLAILPLFLFFLGYTQYQKQQVVNYKQNYCYPKLDSKIYYLGIIYAIIGFACSIVIGNVDIEQQQVSQWTGILTVYAFFQRTLYIAFGINFYFALIKRHFLNWLIFSFTAFWPIFQFIFYARRTDAATYLFIVLLTLFFVKKIILPRKLIIPGIIIGSFIINAIGSLRGELSTIEIGYSNWQDFWNFEWIDNWFQAVQNVQWWEEGTAFLQPSEEGDSYLKTTFSETKFAASFIEASNELSQFTYGTSFWNRIVFGFVPAQFLGKAFKDSLYINLTASPPNLIYYYFSFQTFRTGYIMPIMGELFGHFWFVGFLLCYYIGCWFKRLWLAVNLKPTLSDQILYPIALVFTFSLFLGGVSGFAFNMLNFYIFLLPVKYIESLSNSRAQRLTVYQNFPKRD